MTFSEFWRELGYQWRWRRQNFSDRWDQIPPRNKALISLAIVAVTLALPLGVARLVRSDAGRASGAGSRVVTLYTSVDEPLWRPIVAAFEADTGITVNVVGDTEATKAVGVMTRLLAERATPKADVWWSSEPSTTIQLKRDGLLVLYSSRAELTMPNAWPAALRCPDGEWYGHAVRARVIAFDTRKFTRTTAPQTLRALTDKALRGRVGMARPQFGSTRTHLGALVALAGEEATRRWLTDLATNEVRLYDGNSAVVRALSNGEIDVGLTDTDDVWAGQRLQWPVDFIFEKPDAPGAKPNGPGAAPLPAIGPVALPATVARVKHGPNPVEAEYLIDYLLSGKVERLLAESESRNTPVRPDVLKDFPQLALPRTAEVTVESITDGIPIALRLCDEVFGSR